jgi:hypothetical protein
VGEPGAGMAGEADRQLPDADGRRLCRGGPRRRRLDRGRAQDPEPDARPDGPGSLARGGGRDGRAGRLHADGAPASTIPTCRPSTGPT